MNRKFLIGGLLIVAAVVYLIVSSTSAAAQYYLTIDELIAKTDLGDRDIKVSGAVIGDSIEYDSSNLILRFTLANVPADKDEIDAAGGLAKVLHQAVEDPTASRMDVVYEGPMPDLLRDEAQAILTGRMGQDGAFHADELLLKCPTKYEEEIPLQAEEG